MERSIPKRGALVALSANDMNQHNQRDSRQKQWKEKQQNDSRDCKKLIKSFSSSHTRDNIKDLSNPSLLENIQPINDPTSHLTSVSSPRTHNYNYEINFPPEPMKLLFEPCINSQIGCKVLKLQFDKGQQRNQSHLQKIQVGHVMTTIDGIDVTFTPFTDIMKLLDQRSSVHKVLGFKITATAALMCPPTPLTPTHPLTSQPKQNTPTTPKFVKFRSPLIPSPTFSSPPLSPQRGREEQDISSYSMTSSNHLSAYSLNDSNSVLEHYSEVPLSSPVPHQPSEAAVKRESFSSHGTSPPVALSNQSQSLQRTHHRSQIEEVSSPPSSAPTAPSLTPNFEEKYRKLLQDLSQSYLELRDYQDRVMALEDSLLEHRLNEENEKKRGDQMRQKLLKLEKGMDGLTQLRGEEIADRDAWISRATAAEKEMNEQKVEYKNKLMEVLKSSEKKYQELSEEFEQTVRAHRVEVMSLRVELKERSEREEALRKKYQEELERDHEERLEMISVNEKERIEREEERERSQERGVRFEKEKRELERREREAVEKSEEWRERYLNEKREKERREKEWERESEVRRVEREREVREVREKMSLVQEENEIYKRMNLNLEKVEKELIAKLSNQQIVMSELEEREREREQEQQLAQKKRREEQKSAQEMISKLEQEVTKYRNSSEEVERKLLEVSAGMEVKSKGYEAELREREEAMIRLREECVVVEREGREVMAAQEREFRSHFIRFENEKRQQEINFLESQQRNLQMQFANQELSGTIASLEKQLQQCQEHLHDSHQSLHLQQKKVKDMTALVFKLKNRLTHGLQQFHSELSDLKDLLLRNGSSADALFSQTIDQIATKINSLGRAQAPAPSCCCVETRKMIEMAAAAVEHAKGINNSSSALSVSREFRSPSIGTTTTEEEEEQTQTSSPSVKASFLAEWWGRYGKELAMTSNRNNYFQLAPSSQHSNGHSHLLTPFRDRDRDRSFLITSTPSPSLSLTEAGRGEGEGEELSPLTQYFEKTLQEIPCVQSHHRSLKSSAYPLSENDDVVSLETLLHELNAMNTSSDSAVAVARTRSGEVCWALSSEQNELSDLRQEVRRLFAENEDQKRMSELRELELIRILKENDELVRVRGSNDVLVAEKCQENENLKKRVWELKSELEEFVSKYEMETRKLQRAVEQKKTELAQQEEVTRRLEIDLQEQRQLLQTASEEIMSLQGTIRRSEESQRQYQLQLQLQDRQFQEEEQRERERQRQREERERERKEERHRQEREKERERLEEREREAQARQERERELERKEYLRELSALEGNYEQQLRESDMREKVLKESQMKIQREAEEAKRKYEKLEGELVTALRALNQKDLQYSIIFQQHQEMLREKQELNEVILECSQQPLSPPQQQQEQEMNSFRSLSITSSTTSSSAMEATSCHHCHQPSPLGSLITPAATSLSTRTAVTASPSPSPLIQEKESILLFTQQLDCIMRETERREVEWNSRHQELEMLVHEWRLKANTALAQVISFKEQSLHILREKQIMEQELSQSWDLIHRQRNEIYELQQIVETLALEAQRTTQDVVHSHSHNRRSFQSMLFPIPQGSTPLTRSYLRQEEEEEGQGQEQAEGQQSISRLSHGDAMGCSSSWDTSLSTWSQIIPRVNQRRYEEEQQKTRMDEALMMELMKIQELHENKEISSPPLPQGEATHRPHHTRSCTRPRNRVRFPEKGYQFLIKLLIRIWRNSRRDSSSSAKDIQPFSSSSSSSTAKALISALSKSEFNAVLPRHPAEDWCTETENETETSASPFILINPPLSPSPPRPRSSFDSIFDLLRSSPPVTILTASSQDDPLEQQQQHISHSISGSIYQTFLIQNHLSSGGGDAGDSVHGDDDDSNPYPLLGDLGYDEEDVEDDILSVDNSEGPGEEGNRDEQEGEGNSFYISSSSFSETSSPLRST